jgi:hypothetical protein
MHLTFRTISVRHLCEKRSVARKVLGPTGAAGLFRLLSDLEAARAFAELPPLDMRFPFPDDDTLAAIPINGELELVVRARRAKGLPGQTVLPDWAKVRRIMIEEVRSCRS